MELPEKKRNLIAQFLLFLFALTLFIILGAIGTVYTFVKSWRRHGFVGSTHCLAQVFRSMTVGIDQTGNVALADFMNSHAIVKEGYQYGNVDETISSATGKNERDGTLTRFGRFFTSVLSLFEYNHAVKWIEEDKN